MDHYSILDHSSPSPVDEGVLLGASATRSETAGISAQIAAANALLTSPSGMEQRSVGSGSMGSRSIEPRFPGEDSGRSLAEMAYADLDAALQLLAERAQYITGASGAAIALRRGEYNDMLCRASVGCNAPELGALLSMEYGLSGESVRTRQLLRCDDAERDPRVNRDVCRDLGIASVAVMPIVSREQVLGVFELLSGKPRAFDERDLSALLRLSEMVEIAVKHAVAAQVVPDLLAPDILLADLPRPVIAESKPSVEAIASRTPSPEPAIRAAIPVPPAEQTRKVPPCEVPLPKQEQAIPVPKKPLFWSAAMRAQAGAQVGAQTGGQVKQPVENMEIGRAHV